MRFRRKFDTNADIEAILGKCGAVALVCVLVWLGWALQRVEASLAVIAGVGFVACVAYERRWWALAFAGCCAVWTGLALVTPECGKAVIMVLLQ